MRSLRWARTQEGVSLSERLAPRHTRGRRPQGTGEGGHRGAEAHRGTRLGERAGSGRFSSRPPLRPPLRSGQPGAERGRRQTSGLHNPDTITDFVVLGLGSPGSSHTSPCFRCCLPLLPSQRAPLMASLPSQWAPLTATLPAEAKASPHTCCYLSSLPLGLQPTYLCRVSPQLYQTESF